jgi:hypothetical protein
MLAEVFVLLAVAVTALGHAGADHSKHGYRFNGPLDFECLGGKGNATWSTEHAPRCVDQGSRPLSLKFGIDAMLMCMLKFEADDVSFLMDVIERRKEWRCRVRMTPGHDEFHIPFSIPIWGVVEAT